MKIITSLKISFYNFFTKKEDIMTKYECTVCSYIYDPDEGDPDEGLAPGIAFEDIPEDRFCPLCGVGKKYFVVME